MIAVDVVLFRTTAKILHVVHPGRQTETYTDAGNFQLGSSFAGCITSGSEGSHAGSFGNFCLGGLHIGRSKSGIHIHHSARVYLIGDNVQIAGCQQIGSLQQDSFVFCTYLRIRHVEVFAGLFPYVEAFGSTVTVIVVVRRTPEIGLDAESVFEVFCSVHFV